MPNVEKRTISLPAEQAAYLDEMVKSGNYASAREVVREGLRALRQRDAAVETWRRAAKRYAQKSSQFTMP